MSVKVVKLVSNKAQKSHFSYYKLQMGTSDQVSQDHVILALEGGGGGQMRDLSMDLSS